MVVKIEEIEERIRKAAKKAGRDPSEIALVAVTKRSEVEEIRAAIDGGIRAIGEGRIEAIDKFRSLPPVAKHFIGNLQTNKVKAVVQHFDCIQSLDSWKLATEIDKRARDLGKIMPVMIEVRFEEQKNGIGPSDVIDFYKRLLTLTNIKVLGLMTMAPLVEPEKTRPYFRKMKALNEKLGLRYLSMGMSNDFEVAIEEGSNMVRIGRALFGTSP
jgi:PLP dependent protein